MQDIKENGKSQLDEVAHEMDYGSSEHLVSSTMADVSVLLIIICYFHFFVHVLNDGFHFYT